MTPTGWLFRDGQRLVVHDSGDGPPILLQHGLCGDASQTAEACSPAHRRITLECRGHGQSDPDGPFSIETFTTDIIALLELLPSPVPVGGISMGAAIATRIAVLRPDLVSALILIRPAWTVENAPDNMAPNAEVGRLLARLPAADARATFATSLTAQRLATEAPDNLASLMGFFSRPQPSTAALLQAISADGPGISEIDLSALRCPALICGTEEDAIHPYAHAADLARMIPGARLVKLPAKGRDKSAHLAALHSAMAKFLKENDSATPQ